MPAAALSAKQTYAAYEGPDAVKAGIGGTRMTKNGIDYWTSGTPPRSFKVIGLITDARKDGIFTGDALGSPAIARQVISVGADAVIVISADTRVIGAAGFGSSFGSGSASYGGGWASFLGSAFGSSYTEEVNKTTTQLLVIKYLDPAASAGAEGAQPVGQRSPLPAPLSPPTEIAQRTATAGDDALPQGPPKRRAKTRSGFCYDVPRSYVGLGSLNRPALTSAAPACFELLER